VGSGTVDDHGSAVLEDPTGKRARWMRWAGRFVFVLFLAWLLAVVLGGLGLTPVVGLPFTHVLRPSQGPPALGKVRPRQPSVSDLRPAVPAKVFAARAAQYGRRALAPGQTKTRPSSSVVRGRDIAGAHEADAVHHRARADYVGAWTEQDDVDVNAYHEEAIA